MTHLRALAALVRLELATRASVLLAAVGLGIAVVPLAVFTRQQPIVVAVVLGVAFCLGAAGLLGAAMLAEPIAAGRIGFFLAQPLTTGALWWGRLLGVTLTAVSASVAVVAPACLWRAGRLDSTEREAIVLWGLALLAALPFAAMGHTVATLLRSRGPRGALDFGAAVLVAALVGWAARELSDAALQGRFAWLAPAALAPLAAILAGHVQLARGRGDLERGQVALSTALWTPLLAIALGTAGATVWALDLEPDDVSTAPLGAVATADSSHWLARGGTVLSGEGPLGFMRLGLSSAFLIDVETGDWARLGRPSHVERRTTIPQTAPTLAQDGSRVAWRDRGGDVFWADLPPSREGGRGGARELRLAARPLPPDLVDARSWALSRDGSRLAAVLAPPRAASSLRRVDRQLRSLLVLDVVSGARLLSVDLPWRSTLLENATDAEVESLSVSLRWVDDARLELAGCLLHRPTERDGEGVLARRRILAGFATIELDPHPASSRFSDVRAFPIQACAAFYVSADGELAIWERDQTGSARIVDTRSGEAISLHEPSRRSLGIVTVDSGVVHLSSSTANGWTADEVRLTWFDRAGRQQGEIAFEGPGRSALGGEVAPGKVLVLRDSANGSSSAPSFRQHLLLFDSVRGSVEPLEARWLGRETRLSPIDAQLDFRDRPTWLPAAGGLISRLFLGADGSLVLLDLEERTLRRVSPAIG